MTFLRAIIGIVVTIGLAVLLGWTRHFKSPAAVTYSWGLSIAVLLLLRWCL